MGALCGRRGACEAQVRRPGCRQTKKFTEPPEQIKQQIAAVKADKSVLEAQKREDFAQLDSGPGGKKSKIFGEGCDFAR
jgi:hypothetical protein